METTKKNNVLRKSTIKLKKNSNYRIRFTDSHKNTIKCNYIYNKHTPHIKHMFPDGFAKRIREYS